MGLTQYRRKRDFQKTREPRGTRAVRQGWRFVVQKHDATRLHYDFRLELDGVLKSWAVPKGPSLDPTQRRLAVAVEDHPLEYRAFEGTIPEDQYGGGTVMLWDQGTWEPLGDAREGFKSGKLKFRLHGEKLSGGWMLVRTGGRTSDPRNWLLIKERDDAARPVADYDVTEREPLSVASGRDLDEIAARPGRVWSSASNGRAKQGAAKQVARRKSKKSGEADHHPRRGSTKNRESLPTVIKAELATLVAKPPDGDEWLHEIKFDGYRILAYVDDGHAILKTRNALDWTPKLSELAATLGKLRVRQAVLDGELVALDKQGLSDFQVLQTAIHENKKGALIYFVFDLLWLNGEDLRPLPLIERKARLAKLGIPADRGPVRVVEHLVGSGPEVFAEAQRMGLEGIISKRVDRPYQAGRSLDWVKSKSSGNAEFVIAGFTDPEGSRQGFGALLLGYYEKPGELIYAGRVGTGFDDALLASMARKLKAREIKDPPFASGPVKRERRAHWVRPELVAQVRFSNWTRDGLLRQPVFLGLREDKAAATVHRERPAPLGKTERQSKGRTQSRPGAAKATSAGGRSKASPADAEVIEGVRLTHPDKLLYPDEGITKRDLAEYYLAVAEWMLPHIADRPLAIVRCPDGVSGGRFFQKHPNQGTLEGLARVKIAESDGLREYVVVQKPTDLVELVQIGALELHQWGSRRDEVERPDRLIFDLDPDPKVSWPRIVAAARQIRDLLEELGLESFVKTTGGKGLHLVVPIARRHDWEYVKDFCRSLARAIERAAPNEFVSTMSKSARHGKIFVDYLRNQRGATAVAAYSTRAKPDAPVSMPLAWDELGSVKSADQFRVNNALRRVKTRKKEPWAGIEKVRQTLSDRMLKQLV